MSWGNSMLRSMLIVTLMSLVINIVLMGVNIYNLRQIKATRKIWESMPKPCPPDMRQFQPESCYVVLHKREPRKDSA